MKGFINRFAALILAAAFVLSLAGCGSGTNSFTWFVDEIPANLDPQIAATSADVIACKNLYGSLVRLDPNGELVPDLAERWTVSADGLQYTFTIKEGLRYTASRGAETDYTITAEDFVYAFRRVFSADTQSPFAVEFSALENSAAVLAGTAAPSELGVRADGERTLVFTLSERDDNFLQKLTLPGASPCDQEFFESTRGTYGLSTSSTLSSGSFYIYNWTSSGLFLRRTPNGTLVDSLRLVQNTSATTQSAEQLILNERCSAALDTTAAPTSLRSISYADTTWCLLFNADTVFASAQLRQALGMAALRADYMPASALYSSVGGLVPEGLTVDGIDYRAAAGNMTPLAGSIDQAYQLYMEARQELSTNDFRDVTLLVPSSAGLLQSAEQINSVWQKELSLFFSIEEVDDETFEQRLASGDYSIALAPVTVDDGSVYSLLSRFSGGLTGYSDANYNSLLGLAASSSGSARVSALASAEQRLLSSGAVVPLFAQARRLLLADGINGLVFDPYGPVLDLTYTTIG